MRNSKPKYMVRASAINSLSMKQDSLISVVASSSFTVPQQVELSAFGCHHCGTTFAAHKGLEPFCITCGSDDVELDADQPLAPERIAEDQELSGIICAHCHSNNILTDVVAAKLGGKMHCVTCGESIDFNAPEVDDELPEVNPLDFQSDFDGEVDLDEKACGDKPSGNPLDTTIVRQHAAKVDGTDEDLVPPIDADEPGTTTVPVAADVMDVPMTDVVPDADGEGFDVATTDDVMVAMVSGVPVATLVKANAGDFADVWGKSSFVRAVKAAVVQAGRNKALASFGFAPIVAQFPFKQLVDAAVASAVVAEQAKVVASVNSLQQDYRQSLAIAAAGLNKGFFKGKDHALKAALFDELNAAGVRAPAKLVDKVFASAGAQFMGTLLETAEEVMAKSLEVRNELAAVVDTTPYVEAPDVDEDDDLAGDTAKARLQTHAGVRISAAETASVRPAVGQRLFGTR